MALKVNTRLILAQSLEELLKNKEFEQLTVSDIVNNCGASRSVFYRHFQDKHDLAIWSYQHFLDELNALFVFEDASSILEAKTQTLKFLYAKRNYFKKIVKYSGQNNYIDCFINLFIDNSCALIKKKFNSGNIPDELLFSIKYTSIAHAYLIKEWLEKDCPETPEKLSELLMLNSQYYNNQVNELC